MDEFAGQTVVITGGASGIGFALAEAFGVRGARVVIADLSEPRLTEATSRLSESGLDAYGFSVDVTVPESVQELARRCRELGDVDVVCNNAGIATWGPVATATRADWEFTMGVNFWGVVNGVEAFLPHLLERGRGHLVNTASMSGLIGMEYLGVYCASKFAVVGLTESLARELKDSGVGVTLVCPMVVDTPINEHSVTMRPEALRNPGVAAEGPDTLAGSVIPAAAVAEQVVEAVMHNRLYVLTHAEQGPILARRAHRLAEAAERIPPP